MKLSLIRKRDEKVKRKQVARSRKDHLFNENIPVQKEPVASIFQ